MCRWLAYSGAPLALDEFLFKPRNSLIHQSRSSSMSEETFHGDGFGVGWYGGHVERPGLYTCIHPAWNDHNLRTLAEQIEAPVFLAHVRASTGGAVQAANCHPFQFQNWLFQHNGLVQDFVAIRRTLHFAVAPELYPFIQGTTDSELMFYLALTHGLAQDPPLGLARMVGHVETVGRAAGVENPVQMTVAVSDGTRTWVVRYSSEGRSRTLFHSRNVSALREISPYFSRYSDDAVLVVSEPLDDLTGLWQEVEEGTLVEIHRGKVTYREFRPQVPEGVPMELPPAPFHAGPMVPSEA
jgi:glutamine amidotransferase